MESNCEWISVSTLASLRGCSKQTIYNKIKKGEFETKRFKRGIMDGILVKYEIESE